MKSLIFYKGQEIDADVIHTDNTVRVEGTDSLYRGADGFYYLERFREPADGDFFTLHRISVTAAILWSIDNIDRFNWVRQDAADCLMANRTYDGPAFAAAYSTVPSKPLPGVEDDAETEDEATEHEQLPDREFSFNFKPTRQRVGNYTRIKVPGDLVAEVEALAETFGLTPRAFLRRHIEGTLPGQTHWRHRATAPLADLLKPEHVGFVCMDAAMAQRIERAAESRDQTMDEFVAECIGEAVDCFEEQILIHPQTGALLTNGGDLYRRLETRETAPPIGKENDPQFQPPPPKVRMFLDHEAAALVQEYLQVSPWSYTTADIINGCVTLGLELAFSNREEAERMSGLDCADFHDGDWGTVEESIYNALKQRTGGKSPHIKGAPGEPIGEDVTLTFTVPVLSDALPACLDPAAAALVRRYLGVSPRNYTAAEIIAGCVSYALATVFEDLEYRRRHCPQDGPGFTHDGRRFADGGWGYVERDIVNVRQRREGKPEYDGDEPDDTSTTSKSESGQPATGTSPVYSAEYLSTLPEVPPATGRRQPGNPADVALLAAADPSLDDADEDDDQDKEPPTATDEGNGKEGK